MLLRHKAAIVAAFLAGDFFGAAAMDVMHSNLDHPALISEAHAAPVPPACEWPPEVQQMQSILAAMPLDISPVPLGEPPQARPSNPRQRPVRNMAELIAREG